MQSQSVNYLWIQTVEVIFECLYDPISNTASFSSPESSDSYLSLRDGGVSMWAWVTWVAALDVSTTEDNKGSPYTERIWFLLKFYNKFFILYFDWNFLKLKIYIHVFCFSSFLRKKMVKKKMLLEVYSSIMQTSNKKLCFIFIKNLMWF